MHPDHAEDLQDEARRAAIHHIQVEVTHLRTPLAEECSPHPGVASLEGRVLRVLRSGEPPLVAGTLLRFQIEPCVPIGHPELLSTSPCVLGEALADARWIEVWLGADLCARQAAVELLGEAP